MRTIGVRFRLHSSPRRGLINIRRPLGDPAYVTAERQLSRELLRVVATLCSTALLLATGWISRGHEPLIGLAGIAVEAWIRSQLPSNKIRVPVVLVLLTSSDCSELLTELAAIETAHRSGLARVTLIASDGEAGAARLRSVLEREKIPLPVLALSWESTVAFAFRHRVRRIPVAFQRTSSGALDRIGLSTLVGRLTG